MSIETKSVRLDAETVRVAKVAAARVGEPMHVWFARAVALRLEKEKDSGVRSAKRVASVVFDEEG